MVAKFTTTVHNHTDQDVCISQPGVFTTSRQVVKPKTVKTLSFKIGLVRRYLKGNRPPGDVKVEVKAGERKPGERVRLRCSNQEFDVVQTSNYTIERVHQVDNNGVCGSGIAIHYVEEFFSCTSSLTFSLRSPFPDEYLSSSCSSYSSDVNLETVFNREREWISTPSSPDNQSCSSSRECDKSVINVGLQDRILRAPHGRRYPWLLHPPSTSQIRSGRSMTADLHSHRFRELMLSATLASSNPGSDDNSLTESDSVASLVDSLNRKTRSLPSDPRLFVPHTQRSRLASTSSSTTSSSDIAVSSKLHLARVRGGKVRSNSDNQPSGGTPGKILHRDELLRLINSGMNSTNPFVTDQGCV